MRRPQIVALTTLLALAAVAGCDRNRERDPKAEQVNGDQEETSAEAEEPTEKKQGASSGESAANESGESAGGETASAADAINGFGHALLEGADEGNTAFSATSISTVMGMAYAGAGGETANEIAEAMQYPDKGAVASLGALGDTLAERAGEVSEERTVELSLVDDIWLQPGFEVGDEYLERLETHFGAQPRETDFRSNPEKARSTINDYVAEQTHDKIPELLPKSAVSQDTRTVLTNALYFKAPWETPFEKEGTEKEPFETSEGDKQVPTMSQEAHFRLYEGDNFRAVELPYAGGELAALVVLPDEGEREAVEETMDAEQFTSIVDGLERTYVDLKLPKFEVRQKLDVADRLQKMGVEQAFDASADFDAIHPKVFLEAVVHEAYVAVDEQGTEAAAATAASMAVTSMPPETTQFHVDRPFLFYVYDKPTGTALFTTRIVDPSGQR